MTRAPEAKREKNPDRRPPLDLTPAIGNIPFRMALAGGWIDQPFVSRLNPDPPGSMVVVSLKPDIRFMDRAGMATGTRRVARRIWHDSLPADRDPASLARELYRAENAGKADPSGSQDMIGMVYPGISRLDYDAEFEGGVFPRRIETCRDPEVVRWLERTVHLIPVAPRPEGYNPLGEQRLDPRWIARLGRTGRECFEAILRRDVNVLGASFNECMLCWEAILPCTVRHPTLQIDLMSLLKCYQRSYPGAMYSGCGGGYLLVASRRRPPGSFQVSIRASPENCHGNGHC